MKTLFILYLFLLTILVVSGVVFLSSNTKQHKQGTSLKFYSTDLLANRPTNPSLNDIVKIDGIVWQKGMTATFLAQTNNTQNGVYWKHSHSGNVVRLVQFSADTYCQLTVLQGEIFANSQLLVIGPTQTVKDFVTINPEDRDQVTVTVDQLLVVGDAVAKTMLIENNLNGANLDNNYTVISNTATNWNTVTATEVDQLTNMDPNTTINSTSWTSISTLDQTLKTSDTVTFASVKSNNLFATFPSEIIYVQSSGSYDWTGLNPCGVTVEIQAGGGGGGGYLALYRAGGAGGSGSMLRIWFNADDIGANSGLDYTVGGGGSGSGASNGSSGGNSTVSWKNGALIATAYAGGGGSLASISAGGRGGSAGSTPAFASTTYNHITVPGRVGKNGLYNVQSIPNWNGPNGGNSFYGYGGKGANASTAVTGQLGGGGGGGARYFNSVSGASGGTGFVRILIYS